MMNRPISDDLELVAYFVEVEDFVCVCVCVAIDTRTIEYSRRLMEFCVGWRTMNWCLLHEDMWPNVSVDQPTNKTNQEATIEAEDTSD